MKIRYYFMSMVMAAAALTGFTSCSDDDDDPVVPTDELTFSTDQLRVKIGEENRQLLPVATGAGEYNAYSLNPEIADVVTGEDGQAYVEGFKNGTASLVVSDKANRYKRLTVSVYTTDVMTIDNAAISINSTLGATTTVENCATVVGNGGYSAVSDNAGVSVSVDENGNVTVNGRGRLEDYTATLTISDISGLSVEMKVTVITSLDGFTDSDIAAILAKTEGTIWADCKDPSDGNTPYYWRYRNYGYGEWLNSTDGDTKKLGWWANMWGSDYGGIRIEYPASAAVDAEVEGTLFFQYSNKSWYDCYEYPGTVKVIEDNATRTVVIAWQIDRTNERINRGYVVYYK